jgi:hypothetical protein
MCIWQEVRKNIQDSNVEGNIQPVPPNTSNRQGVQVRTLQTTQNDQTPRTRTSSVPSQGRQEAKNNRRRPSGERSSEQSPPSPGRTHRKNHAAGMAGEGIPSWLSHKINSHPKAGTEAWITPATIIAGQRKAAPRESNKRRKATSSTGLTLIIPNESERQSRRRTRPRRQAAVACAEKLAGDQCRQAWGNVEVVIQEECGVPRKIIKKPDTKRDKSRGEGEGHLPPHKASDLGGKGGGTSPSKKREQSREMEGGIPPPPTKKGKSIRGAGPQPGEG